MTFQDQHLYQGPVGLLPPNGFGLGTPCNGWLSAQSSDADRQSRRLDHYRRLHELRANNYEKWAKVDADEQRQRTASLHQRWIESRTKRTSVGKSKATSGGAGGRHDVTSVSTVVAGSGRTPMKAKRRVNSSTCASDDADAAVNSSQLPCFVGSSPPSSTVPAVTPCRRQSTTTLVVDQSDENSPNLPGSSLHGPGSSEAASALGKMSPANTMDSFLVPAASTTADMDDPNMAAGKSTTSFDCKQELSTSDDCMLDMNLSFDLDFNVEAGDLDCDWSTWPSLSADILDDAGKDALCQSADAETAKSVDTVDSVVVSVPSSTVERLPTNTKFDLVVTQHGNYVVQSSSQATRSTVSNTDYPLQHDGQLHQTVGSAEVAGDSKQDDGAMVAGTGQSDATRIDLAPAAWMTKPIPAEQRFSSQQQVFVHQQQKAALRRQLQLQQQQQIMRCGEQLQQQHWTQHPFSSVPQQQQWQPEVNTQMLQQRRQREALIQRQQHEQLLIQNMQQQQMASMQSRQQCWQQQLLKRSKMACAASDGPSPQMAQASYAQAQQPHKLGRQFSSPFFQSIKTETSGAFTASMEAPVAAQQLPSYDSAYACRLRLQPSQIQSSSLHCARLQMRAASSIHMRRHSDNPVSYSVPTAHQHSQPSCQYQADPAWQPTLHRQAVQSSAIQASTSAGGAMFYPMQPSPWCGGNGGASNSDSCLNPAIVGPSTNQSIPNACSLSGSARNFIPNAAQRGTGPMTVHDSDGRVVGHCQDDSISQTLEWPNF